MFFRSILCSLVAVTITAQQYQSNKYPAGVHPNLCPHYPYCDNSVLARYVQGTADAFQPATVPGYPASLSPHVCPNYPYCSHHIPSEAINYRRNTPSYVHPIVAAATVQHPLYAVVPNVGSAAKYPSGIDPASCPNYPYCH